MNNRLKIFITGPQGSGKSTQAKIIAKKYGLYFLSSGDLCRQISRENSIRGKIFKAALDKGVYVPDEEIGQVVKEILSGEEAMRGFVSDAYPRTMNQLTEFDPEFNYVFELVIPEDLTMERLRQRHREDDSEEQIKSRLNEYYSRTSKVNDYYQKLGILNRINGNQELQKVTTTIEQILKTKGVEPI